jgi:tetratricopeptide (TPR) repeat protein
MDEAHDSDPEMLDTRGYLLHLLNRNEEALADLQRAIDRLKNDFNQDPFDSLKRMQIRRSLAVMYHHRGLVFEQLGRTAEAEQDRKHGDRLGYDPQHGVL